MTRVYVLLGLMLSSACSSSSGGGGGGQDAGGVGGLVVVGGTGGGGGSGASAISCDPFEGNSCICANSPNGSNGFDCSEVSVGGTVLCCADSAYPDSGTCDCKRSACTELSGVGTCTCGYAEADGIASNCVGYEVCCNIELSGAIIGCVCGGPETDCNGIGSAATGCSAATGTCGPNRVQVTSCSEPHAP